MPEQFPDNQAASIAAEESAVLNRVAVLDAGGQYVDMVKKAVERTGIPADVLPLHTPVEDITGQYGAVIVSGSPASSHEETAPQFDPALLESNLPILGICYGKQAMAVALGGTVVKNAIREDGRVTTRVDTSHPLFSGSKEEFTGLFTHGDFVTRLPEGFTAIGQHSLSDGMVAYSAMARGNKIGVQFHPEVFDDTPEGYQLFHNFLFSIAGLAADETFQESRLAGLINKKCREMVELADGRDVIGFVSGGVDSGVAAGLAARAFEPGTFHAYYIDNGFMRDEDDMVIEDLRAAGIAVTKIDAVGRFEQATAVIDGDEVGPLVSTTDPETKRKLIGKAFIDVQNNIISSLELSEALLLQGTNAADRIESGHSTGGMHTETIKTHHNQVTEVQELKARGLLLEPLDDLFKDEIRALGRELGLPHDLVERHPFPGPGLAVRILCAERYEPAVSASPIEADVRSYLFGQSFDANRAVVADMLPIKSVGVGGDERSHTAVAAIRNAGLSAGDLARLGTELPAHFRGHINRVIYALGELSLANRTITKTMLTADVRSQLRHADRIVFDGMRQFDVLSKIKQMPVVLIPVSFGESGQRSVVLRPVTTSTFMTVQAMLPDRDLPREFFDSVTQRIFTEVPGISQVFLDLTNKPPGTTEWE